MNQNTKFNAAILIIGNEILSGRTRDQCIDQSAMSYSVCKFKTSVHGATFLMTSHVRLRQKLVITQY